MRWHQVGPKASERRNFCFLAYKGKAVAIHRIKFTTGLIELAAVMATEKVSRKATKASKAFSNFILENA
jgi:hypothetical protein